MTLEVLMSCMHQQDAQLVQKANLTGNVVMINQCDCDGYKEYATHNGMVRMFSSKERGLTKSRNAAIRNARADICMLCDEDSVFVPDYESIILDAYNDLPQADVIAFKLINFPTSLEDKLIRLRFPKTMKICSCQISFRREKLLAAGVKFDELLGAGTGNGAEEELKFLLECEKAGLKMYYVPVEVASVTQEASTWFGGFDETFFENRGATTRYILGTGMASVYALYYIARKKNMYSETITPRHALRAIFRGIQEDKISKQARRQKELEYTR